MREESTGGLAGCVKMPFGRRMVAGRPESGGAIQVEEMPLWGLVRGGGVGGWGGGVGGWGRGGVGGGVGVGWGRGGVGGGQHFERAIWGPLHCPVPTAPCFYWDQGFGSGFGGADADSFHCHHSATKFQILWASRAFIHSFVVY